MTMQQRHLVLRAHARPRISALRPSFRHARFRRAYADQPLPPPPLPPRRSRFGAIRWAWRLTYVSALAGLGFVGYQVYALRYPIEQDEPDPSKKTLVILGTFALFKETS